LVQEVENIKSLRTRIKSQLDLARSDYKRGDKVGLSPELKAIEEAGIYGQRGLPESENVKEIDRLRNANFDKLKNRQDAADLERYTKELELNPTDDPEQLAERLAADKEYNKQLKSKVDKYKDIGRSPIERMAVRGSRGAVDLANKGANYLSDNTPNLGGVLAGKNADKAYDIISSWWGETPKENESTDDFLKAVRENDEQYGIVPINDSERKALSVDRASEEKQKKGGKTTIY
jgi:hypothetical protein